MSCASGFEPAEREGPGYRSAESGFTLLETSIGVSIFAMILLTLAAWESQAIHGAEGRAAMEQLKTYINLTRSYARTTGNGATLYVAPDPNDPTKQIIQVLRYRPMKICPVAVAGRCGLSADNTIPTAHVASALSLQNERGTASRYFGLFFSSISTVSAAADWTYTAQTYTDFPVEPACTLGSIQIKLINANGNTPSRTLQIDCSTASYSEINA